MQINNSSFLYGQQGFQRSQDRLDQASQKVADASKQTLGSDQTKDSGLYGSPIQDGLIEAKSSELDAKANAKVIEASDKTIGRLIDISV
ncbi:MAG: hypothetical protein ACPGRG_09845 [Marinomonas sp.]|jgi:hypothetical protein|uniref:Flagellar biosynthesis protein FlgE n=1 Tax=Marinomonas pontica TaxID=264739 RepID=A0ABN6WP00_9GAMM|nr:hypothetical protein [Marinomonas pontica]MCW8355339.1 hypothetical protein [Marinomonas pontica]BDX03595.1 hypothetical protein MACH16_23430 [Marinomonas pontica]